MIDNKIRLIEFLRALLHYAYRIDLSSKKMNSHYEKHIFVCTNQKTQGKKCCANADAENIKDHFKKQLVAKGLHGPDKVRVSSSGCLGRCNLGPCIVIYPEGIWYGYKNIKDIDSIIERHLINGELIKELEINPKI